VADMERFEERGVDLEGIVKCLLVPPIGTPFGNGRSYYPPIVPFRENDRLLFSFCRSCSKEYKVGCKDPTYFCHHFDDIDRAFVATITSAELVAALSTGYTVKKLFRVYNFDVWTTDLFKNYVKEFLKIKIESSGWPSDCPTHESRKLYVEKILEDYGIVINPQNVIFNPGMRYIAKVVLCNFMIFH
jgi:hypothetical protein